MNVAKMIDLCLLRPELTTDDILAGCAIAARPDVAAACVRSSDVPLAVTALAGTGVLIGTVVGFPHGYTTTAVKTFETTALIEAGANEVDMVQHIGRLCAGETAYVYDDIAAVVAAASGRVVEVILETACLTDAEKMTGCRVAVQAGAGFVKTGTGFASSGATLADVQVTRATVSPSVQVKAAGGVRTLDTFLPLYHPVANRFGATATETILDDVAGRERGDHTPVPSPVPATTPSRDDY